MKHIIVSIFLAVALTSCSEYSFRSTDEIVFDENALHDEEYVKIIYSSGAPDDGIAIDYYVHMIGVSQETNDTVNIFTPSTYMVEDGKLFYYFISENTDSGKLLKNLQKVIDGAQLSDLSHDKLEKVASNNKGQDWEVNTYPTICGTLAIDIKKTVDGPPPTLDDLKEYID